MLEHVVLIDARAVRVDTKFFEPLEHLLTSFLPTVREPWSAECPVDRGTNQWKRKHKHHPAQKHWTARPTIEQHR